MNIEFMVSIWPTVEKTSENYNEMLRRGLLIRQDRGIRASMEGRGYAIHFDATHPEARKFVWEAAKRNYFDKGIKVFWLDEAEPEYTVYDFEIYRYNAGPNLSIGNIYPVEYARTFYEGQKAAGQENIVNLLRCAWAGSQKYGALVWSGDIASSWSSFRNQLSAGLNMGIAGLSWFTTDVSNISGLSLPLPPFSRSFLQYVLSSVKMNDILTLNEQIGGFHGGVPEDPAFRELFTRWFQWGAFCPVMRLHGDREPKQPRLGTTGGSFCLSGAPNEVWSYGEEVYKICEKYLRIREEMRDYTRSIMKAAHESGDPIMRPVFYDFPEDPKAWQIDDQYMYGPKYLVAPVLAPGQTKRDVYLPGAEIKWKGVDGQVYEGGKTITADCPLDTIPVFTRDL